MPNNATTQTGSGTPQSFNDWVHKHHDSREQRLWQVQCENNRSTQSCVPSKQSTQNLFIPIFSYTQAPSQRQSRHGDKEQLERLKGIFKELDSTGLKRRLSIPRAELHEHLQQLTAQFPNFRDVIELVIAPHLHMLRTGIPMRMPPLLLVGPAGIGKTAFAHQLAKLCNAPEPVFISIAEEDNGSTLIGSSTYWANTQPGVLFATLAWGPGGMEEACNTAVANPIIILDEIDKVAFNSGQKSGTDPLGSLYRLLEVETSKRVQDRSLTDLVMDASHVRYIATANAIEPIPELMLPLFCGVLSSLLTLPFCAVPRTSVARI